MYLRKAVDDTFDHHEEELEGVKYIDNLPTEIYGTGLGLDSVHFLQFWKNDEVKDNEWEEEDDGKTNGKNKKGDDDEDSELGEDYLEEFLMENTKETNTGKMSCSICKNNKKITYEGIKKHFINTHQKDYESSRFGDLTPWNEALKINKKAEEFLEKELFNMGNPESMFEDMFGMGGMSGMGGGKESKKVMKDMEKMMMEMMFDPGMGGMSGMGIGGGSKKKKTKKKK
jgi:hypothetical protein